MHAITIIISVFREKKKKKKKRFYLLLFQTWYRLSHENWTTYTVPGSVSRSCLENFFSVKTGSTLLCWHLSNTVKHIQFSACLILLGCVCVRVCVSEHTHTHTRHSECYRTALRVFTFNLSSVLFVSPCSPACDPPRFKLRNRPGNSETLSTDSSGHKRDNR